MEKEQQRHLPGTIECAGCGAASNTHTDSRLFCADCGADHTFCAQCAVSAAEELAA
jgi:hypothetical protein